MLRCRSTVSSDVRRCRGWSIGGAERIVVFVRHAAPWTSVSSYRQYSVLEGNHLLLNGSFGNRVELIGGEGNTRADLSTPPRFRVETECAANKFYSFAHAK
jgi:hypothetical protein